MVVNTGMEKAEMRKLLNRSKQEPVRCAIGLGENVAFGLLMLHRTKPARAVEGLLKDEFPDVRNTRWGTAFVDVDDNPKLVKFTLNRPVSGMARKLIKTLKGTGFTKVVILSEDGSAMDDYEEADEDEPADEPATASSAAAAVPPPPPPPPVTAPEDNAAQSAALIRALAALVPGIAGAAQGDPGRKQALDKLVRDAGVNIKTGNLTYAANSIAQLKTALAALASAHSADSPTMPAAAVPPPPPPPPVTAPEDNAAQSAALIRALAALVPGIAGAAQGDPGRKQVLDKLVRDAGVNIKTGNLTYAANFIVLLKTALAALASPASSTTPASAASPASPTQLVASREAWTGFRVTIESGIDALRAALATAYAKTPYATQVATSFDAKATPLLARFDTSLATTLDTLAAEPDPARRTTIQDTVRTMVQAYATLADSDTFIADLDTNPFVPLAIRAQAAAALATISKALA